MPEGFSWTVSGATIIVAVGWLVTVGLFLYRRGGLEAGIQNRVEAAHKKLDEISSSASSRQADYDKQVRELATDRQTWRDGLEKEIEQRIANLVQTTDTRIGALVASDRMLADQIGETRENLAKNYMVRSEISEIEKRVTSNQERILNRMDRFEERLTTMSSEILTAIRKLGS